VHDKSEPACCQRAAAPHRIAGATIKIVTCRTPSTKAARRAGREIFVVVSWQMTLSITNHQEKDKDEQPTSSFACALCDTRDVSMFWESYIAHNVHRCRSCDKTYRERFSARRPTIRAASECRTREHVALSTREFEQVCQLWRNCCAITGKRHRALTLVRVDANRPLAPDNAVPVIPAIAKQMGFLLHSSCVVTPPAAHNRSVGVK
jgi:hypothetical protein